MIEGIKGKRVALVGGAGFIGHNMALQIARLGGEAHVGAAMPRG